MHIFILYIEQFHSYITFYHILLNNVHISFLCIFFDKICNMKIKLFVLKITNKSMRKKIVMFQLSCFFFK